MPATSRRTLMTTSSRPTTWTSHPSRLIPIPPGTFLIALFGLTCRAALCFAQRLTFACSSDWNPKRYLEECVAHNDEKTPYEAPTFMFSNPEDFALAMTHSVAQDVVHLGRDIRAIRKEKVQCTFLRNVRSAPSITRV